MKKKRQCQNLPIDVASFYALYSYGWRKVLLTYERNARYEVGGLYTCSLMMSTLIEMITRHGNISYTNWHFLYDGVNITDKLVDKIGYTYASESTRLEKPFHRSSNSIITMYIWGFPVWHCFCFVYVECVDSCVEEMGMVENWKFSICGCSFLQNVLRLLKLKSITSVMDAGMFSSCDLTFGCSKSLLINATNRNIEIICDLGFSPSTVIMLNILICRLMIMNNENIKIYTFYRHKFRIKFVTYARNYFVSS